MASRIEAATGRGKTQSRKSPEATGGPMKSKTVICTSLTGLIITVGHFVLIVLHSENAVSISDLLQALQNVWVGAMSAIYIIIGFALPAFLAGCISLMVVLFPIAIAVWFIAAAIGPSTKNHKTQGFSRGIGRDFQ
jgi:hypothetical protein